MSEKSQRSRVIKALAQFHAVAIENMCALGTPDINCTLGWLELKWLRDWPKRESTVVKWDHHTVDQTLWMRKRVRSGGNCWLVVQVEKPQIWLLFLPSVAVTIVGHVPRSELILVAHKMWKGSSFDREIAECLQNLTQS